MFTMTPEASSMGELIKSSQTPQLRSSQLRGVFGVVVHFLKYLDMELRAIYPQLPFVTQENILFLLPEYTFPGRNLRNDRISSSHHPAHGVWPQMGGQLTSLVADGYVIFWNTTLISIGFDEDNNHVIFETLTLLHG
jgi:hypothetical protein